jgi:hypothetical protein
MPAIDDGGAHRRERAALRAALFVCAQVEAMLLGEVVDPPEHRAEIERRLWRRLFAAQAICGAGGAGSRSRAPPRPHRLTANPCRLTPGPQGGAGAWIPCLCDRALSGSCKAPGIACPGSTRPA